MHLSSLTLKNVRQFDERTFEFQPGFNLLVGENGAGKTTILRGLLAALGGTQQLGRRPKLDDDDIRLRASHAEVIASIHTSSGHVENYSFRKALWERSRRLPRGRDLPLVLFYAANEATCSAMRVKRAQRIRDSKIDDSRGDQEFLYEMERMELARRKPESGERRFGNSQSVRSSLNVRFRRSRLKFGGSTGDSSPTIARCCQPGTWKSARLWTSKCRDKPEPLRCGSFKRAGYRGEGAHTIGQIKRKWFSRQSLESANVGHDTCPTYVKFGRA